MKTAHTKMIITAAILSLVVLSSLLIIENRYAPRLEEKNAEEVVEIFQPVSIGDISYVQAQKDVTINSVIDSSQLLDNGNLVVKFRHNSGKEEPVAVIGPVRYELSKTKAKPNEVIRKTVEIEVV